MYVMICLGGGGACVEWERSKGFLDSFTDSIEDANEYRNSFGTKLTSCRKHVSNLMSHCLMQPSPRIHYEF